jgi:hypothetical protein
MKKVLIAGLVAFALVAIGGKAMAWNVDISGDVYDATVDIQVEVSGTDDEEEYTMWTTVGVDGNGGIDLEGSSGGKNPWLDTDVWTYCGGATIYATQTMLVTGCLEDCPTEPCGDCPEYVYFAHHTATIDGKGKIDLDQQIDDSNNDHEQDLDMWGKGDFTAGMLVSYQIEGCDPVTHAMGATGTNVGFWAAGETDFNENTGQADGGFIAIMGYCDPSCPVCEEEPCEPCIPC